jgi:hypothetical protein
LTNGFEAQVRETSTDSIFALYKEKEMPEFRKWIIVLAAVALFAGLASAQVGTATGGASGVPFTCGVTNGAVTPTLRAEGYTELAGDIVLICSGGSALPLGSIIPTANITVFLNTTVTSRLLSNTTSAYTPSEALLLVDEPGSSVTGYGPSVPQTLCTSSLGGTTSPNIGAGPGGCVEVVGTTAGGVQGVPITQASAAGALFTGSVGANVFQGETFGNQVVFNGIPVLAPTTSGITRVFRITNIRVNANQVTSGGPTPGAVTASLSLNSSTSLAITSSTLTVGFVEQGLSTTNTLFRNTANSGSSGGASLAQCSSTSIGASSGSLGVLQFSENFSTAFKVHGTTTQNIPGTIYNSESGLTIPLITNAVTGSNATEIAGLADYGTRLKATFNNIPSGVSLYVSTRDVTNDFNPGNAAGYSTAQAQLVLSETAQDSTTGTLPLASQTTAYSFFNSASGIGISPVAVNTATGSGLAVWEVVSTNPNQLDTIDFGLYIAYSANAAANSPAPGSFSVTLSFAPTPSGGAFTSTTGAASSSSLTIPRFSDSLDITKTIATISLCTTPLLYPYVINVNGFDTGLAIANPTADPFATAAQAGTCALNFYGSSAPTTNPFISPTVPSGTVYANLASTLAPGFSGYMIAVCNFQFAHGFAFVSDVGARNLAMGYLALVFTTTSRSATEALNN